MNIISWQNLIVAATEGRRITDIRFQFVWEPSEVGIRTDWDPEGDAYATIDGERHAIIGLPDSLTGNFPDHGRAKRQITLSYTSRRNRLGDKSSRIPGLLDHVIWTPPLQDGPKVPRLVDVIKELQRNLESLRGRVEILESRFIEQDQK